VITFLFIFRVRQNQPIIIYYGMTAISLQMKYRTLHTTYAISARGVSAASVILRQLTMRIWPQRVHVNTTTLCCYATRTG